MQRSDHANAHTPLLGFELRLPAAYDRRTALVPERVAEFVAVDGIGSTT